MLRKICNYLVIIALSLIVTGNSVLANSTVERSKNEVKKVVVVDSKDFSYYRGFVSGSGKHSYTVKVETGQEVQIKIHSANGVALKIQTPDGKVKNNSTEKFFEVRLKSEGEYVIELESFSASLYSIEISPNS